MVSLTCSSDLGNFSFLWTDSSSLDKKVCANFTLYSLDIPEGLLFSEGGWSGQRGDYIQDVLNETKINRKKEKIKKN